jgi:hypothetical protein
MEGSYEGTRESAMSAPCVKSEGSGFACCRQPLFEQAPNLGSFDPPPDRIDHDQSSADSATVKAHPVRNV